jgi:hypothetical protein
MASSPTLRPIARNRRLIEGLSVAEGSSTPNDRNHAVAAKLFAATENQGVIRKLACISLFVHI